ncbi:MAG TPA: TetR/AcrR family transcriptional regulator [Rhizomicrobium sp.]|nr:TetR/AcrR family transcriptional regulator [Rhizomicrobium sp.]
MYNGPQLTQMSIRKLPAAKTRLLARRRRSSGEARTEALACARRILIEQGPEAVTLKSVADAVGVSHTNILHHFGSAGELESELMSMMVRDLAAALMEVTARLRSDIEAPRALVDMVFDAFDRGGAGRLAAWIVLSGNIGHLEPVREAVAELVRALEQRFALEKGDTHLGVTSAVLFIALMAFGDSVIGEPLKDMVDRERTASRKVAAFLLPKFFL